MKISHIIVLVIIAVGIGIFVSSSDNASQYVDFDTALTIAKDGDDNKIHVVGELPRDASGEVLGIEYNPMADANFMAFQLIDEKGKKQRVITSTPPPSMTDFKRSEKVVVIGRFENEQFVVSDILLKCPSKYEENTVAVK
jgi:cytochrome c-type biogenesis protein CcmE